MIAFADINLYRYVIYLYNIKHIGSYSAHGNDNDEEQIMSRAETAYQEFSDVVYTYYR